MQALASDNPGDFHRSALDLRISEQHFAQWATTELGQPPTTSAQGSDGN